MEPAEKQIAKPRSKAQSYLALLRVHQWLKNAVVFAALIFGHRLLVAGDILRAAVAFVSFCAVSSTGYILNDWIDREADRPHPEKRRRPLASGELTGTDALTIGSCTAFAAFICGAALGSPFVGILLGYVVLQWLYSSFAKKIVILDVVVIAIGFVMRAYAGGVAISVEVSPWLVLMTFLLALFLALARRRHELVSLGATAGVHRVALEDYTIAMIDQLMAIVTAATIAAYMAYTASGDVEAKLGTRHLYLTVPFVVFGIFRYLFLVHRRQGGADPARLLIQDRQLLMALVLWVAADVVLLYG